MYIHVNLPEEYDSVKQVKYNGNIYVNDNYKYSDEETDIICFQLKNQQASPISQD